MNAFLLITNTTSTASQLKVGIKAGTYKLVTPPSTITVDLTGTRTRSISAQEGKATITFTAAVKLTPDAGYAGLGTPGSTSPENLWWWANPTTSTNSVLLVTDVDNVTRNMLWQSGWTRPAGLTDNIAPANKEYHEMQVQLDEV